MRVRAGQAWGAIPSGSLLCSNGQSKPRVPFAAAPPARGHALGSPGIKGSAGGFSFRCLRDRVAAWPGNSGAEAGAVSGSLGERAEAGSLPAAVALGVLVPAVGMDG